MVAAIYPHDLAGVLRLRPTECPEISLILRAGEIVLSATIGVGYSNVVTLCCSDELLHPHRGGVNEEQFGFGSYHYINIGLLHACYEGRELRTTLTDALN